MAGTRRAGGRGTVSDAARGPRARRARARARPPAALLERSSIRLRPLLRVKSHQRKKKKPPAPVKRAARSFFPAPKWLSSAPSTRGRARPLYDIWLKLWRELARRPSRMSSRCLNHTPHFSRAEDIPPRGRPMLSSISQCHQKLFFLAHHESGPPETPTRGATTPALVMPKHRPAPTARRRRITPSYRTTNSTPRARP